MLWFLLLAAFANPTPTGVRSVIDGQLAAFERGDADAAWEYVAPGLQAQFRSSDRFWRMVQEGYQPVIAPKAVKYGRFGVYEGAPAQWLELTAKDGLIYPALYLLEQAADGSWRTTGCLLFEPEKPVPSV